MFSHITENRRGRPLESYAVVINLISNTRTEKGQTILAELDEIFYKTGIKISDEEMKALTITCDDFHGKWNYKISPA
jgi:hypothetical protein